MKLHLLTSALTSLPLVTSGYMVGRNGANSMFGGRSVIIRSLGDLTATPGDGRCEGPEPDCFSSSSFEGWPNPRRANFGPRRRGRRSRINMNEEAIRQQKEMWNRFFDFANEIKSEFSSRDDPESKEDAVRKQKEWVDRAFNIAQDVASGTTSPRYEIDDTEDLFQVALDVPGVPASAIQVNVVEEKDGEQVLSVQGQRQRRPAPGGTGKQEDDESSSRINKFSKSFSLDSTVDADGITAQLNNGVLLISAPKLPKEEKTKTIPVVVRSNDDIVEDVAVDVAPDVDDDDAADADAPNAEKKEDAGDSMEEK